MYQKDDRNISLYITIGKDNYEENKLYGLYDLTFLINVDLKDVSRFNHGRIHARNIAYSTFVDVKNTDDCR